MRDKNAVIATDDAGSDPAEPSLRERVLKAAFEVFRKRGFSSASTLEIATRAKVSKRDLYALFGSKQAMLGACIKERAGHMRQRSHGCLIAMAAKRTTRRLPPGSQRRKRKGSSAPAIPRSWRHTSSPFCGVAAY